MAYDPNNPESREAQERANRLILLKVREKLAEGYQDAPSHFLLELAQNAYDAGARALWLSLVRMPGPVGDLLIVWNDGDPFGKDQRDSIIGAFSSTKEEGEAGRFGIGFKSVYFHAECADLLSGGYRYRMPRKPWEPSEAWPSGIPETDRKWGLERNLTAEDWKPYQHHLPKEVRRALAEDRDIRNACFVLHLEDGAGDRLRKAILEGGNLRPDLLLFLQSEDLRDGGVRRKSLDTVSILGVAEREVRITKLEVGPWDGWAAPIVGNIHAMDFECRLEGLQGKEPAPVRYRVYREVGGASRAAIAMPIDPREPGGVETILEEESRQLWAWFPTKVPVPWGFLAQCDFHLLSNREQLDASRPNSIEHNRRSLDTLVALLVEVLGGLCGDIGPLPMAWQKALMDSLKGPQKGPQGSQEVLNLTGIVRERILGFLQTHPGLSSAANGEQPGVATRSAIIVVNNEWKEDLYDDLTRLVGPGILPDIPETDPRSRDRSWKLFNGKNWLSWSWVTGGVDNDTWMALGVRIATRLDLALHCRSEVMQPLQDEETPKWINWLDLLSRLSWNTTDLPILQVGLRWPVLTENGEAGSAFEPLFLQHGARQVRPNLYDPIEADGYPVKRVNLRPQDHRRAKDLITWAREILKLQGPDMRELLKVALLRGAGAIPITETRTWPTDDPDAEGTAATQFKDVLTWMTVKDGDLLAGRAFVPTRNAQGLKALRSPRGCLMPHPTGDVDLATGFEAFLEATGQWAVAPELFGFTGRDRQEGAEQDSASWLDEPLQAGQEPPRALLKAWGVGEPMEPTWKTGAGYDPTLAWEKTGRLNHRQWNGLSLHVPFLSGLKEACRHIGLGGEGAGPLFRFLWRRLSEMASWCEFPRSDLGFSRTNPLQCILQREYFGSHFNAVPGEGPVSILTGTGWIPFPEGEVRRPGDVDANDLEGLVGEIPLNRAGHSCLVKLLGFRLPTALPGPQEQIQVLQDEKRELMERLDQEKAEAESARMDAEAAKIEIDRLKKKIEGFEGSGGGTGHPDAQLTPEETIDPDIPIDDLPLMPEEGPSESDLEAAVNLLTSRLGEGLFPFVRVVAPGLPERSPLEGARILVQFYLDALLGSDTVTADGDLRLRDALVENLFNRNKDDVEWGRYVQRILNLTNRAARASDITSRKWYAGYYWTRWVTWLIGLPPAFAGRLADSKAPAEEVCLPPRRPGNLRDYQEQLVGAATSPRSLIQVPTGGGKTRIAAEIILNRLADPQHAGKAILWLAPGAELCEQAIGALRDLHVARSIADEGAEPRPLAFRRWYDSNTRERVLHPEGTAGTVIACTYQTLQGLNADELDRLSPHVVLGVLDEAHRAVAENWRIPIDRLMTDGVPFIGLSATPDGAVRLLGQPVGIECFGTEDPQDVLVRDGILAKPVKAEIRYAGDLMPGIDLPEDEEAEPRGAKEPWRGALARHPQRREAIGAWILSHLKDTVGGRVLFFGSSLEDAGGMTAWLRQEKIPAELVSGRVRGPVRRRILSRFHEGEVGVLCNFGVLTTGFDEPRITAVVIARPTGSLTLYTQMAGRGLRGPGAGGTGECLIADVVDSSRPGLARERWWQMQNRIG